MDRLGSDVRGTKYFPYGAEAVATGNDKDKFGTYFRDSASGLDYADQRFYSNVLGRFMTPDPYEASGGPEEPGSWNRYSYVKGDPVNFKDPSGLQAMEVEGDLPVEYLPRVITQVFSNGENLFEVPVLGFLQRIGRSGRQTDEEDETRTRRRYPHERN